VREYLPKTDKKATFVYSHPPRTFQFYFGYLRMMPKDEYEALRAELLGLGLFRESGDYTLSAKLDEEDLPLAREVYDLVLEKIDSIVERY
jgi:hypothetical protein